MSCSSNTQVHNLVDSEIIVTCDCQWCHKEYRRDQCVIVYPDDPLLINKTLPSIQLSAGNWNSSTLIYRTQPNTVM